MLSGPVAECPPGEFERQAAIVLGLNELVPHHPHVLAGIASALLGHIPLLGIVNSEEQRREAIVNLADWGIAAELMQFVSMPLQGMWVRDYGPVFVRTPQRELMIVDSAYAPPERRNEDLVPTAFAELLKLPVLHVDLTAEGGNILSNGQGLCLITSTLIERNRHRGYDAARVRQLLLKCYGFQNGVCCHPMAGEATGHVDMFATFICADTVVVGSYDRAADPVNSELLDANAAAIAQGSTASGPLKVVRIPMPPREDSLFRTYTNVIFANGKLLVPSYPEVDRRIEEQALATYSSLLPDWSVVPIDTSSIIPFNGALRCLSVNIPHLHDHFNAGDAQSSQSRFFNRSGTYSSVT